MTRHVKGAPMFRILGLWLVLAAWPAAADDGVLILGATGRAGSEIAKQLIARGDSVTAFVRATSDRSRLDGVPVRYVVGDVTNADDIAAAFKDKHYRAIVEALQERPGQPSPYIPAYTNVLPWAKRTGVKQIVMLSSTGADHLPEDFPQINWLAFGDLLERQTKAEHMLRTSGVPYTIIRIGAIIAQRGKPPHPPTGKAYLTEDLSKYAAVAYGDVITHTVGCIDTARCRNKVFVIADDTLADELPHFICRRFATDPDAECG